MATEAALATGQRALAGGQWSEAAAAFAVVLRQEEDPRAQDGLAESLWWLCDIRGSLRAREAAWVGHRRAGNEVAAGQAAIALCIANLVNVGNGPAAMGWLGRAERVTGALDPNPLQGWLWLLRGYTAADHGTAEDLLGRALDFGRRFDDPDLELLALADLGLARVTVGEVASGMALLDEALAGTLAGEARSPDTVVFATCDMLAACHLVADLDRATRWCAAAEAFMHTYGSPFLYARCRVHYGSVLVARGRWQQAEDQLRAAIDLSDDVGPGPRDDAIGQLADLRLLQGHIEEAEAMIAQAADDQAVALAAAAVRLARGEARVATALLHRRLAAIGEEHIDAATTTARLVEATLEDGDIEAAIAAATRLEAMAERHDHSITRARALRARAQVAAATGALDAAIDHLEKARAGFVAHSLPLELARCRFDIARIEAGRRTELAAVEAQAALTAFRSLGATPDADAAEQLLRSLGVATRGGPRSGELLTRREAEVLRLVALGLSNPEIAERLYISRKTAAHHVSHVLTKLGLRNRMEATAYATRPR